MSYHRLAIWTAAIVSLSAAFFGGLYAFTIQKITPRYQWMITNAGFSLVDGARLSSVAVRTESTTYPVGAYEGTCVPLEQIGEKLEQNELTAVVCSWNGTGTEIGIFQADRAREVRTIARQSASSGIGLRDLSKTNVLFQLNPNDW